MESVVNFIKQTSELYQLKIYNKYKAEKLMLHDLLLFDLTDKDEQGFIIDDTENITSLPVEIYASLNQLRESDWTAENVSSIVLQHCSHLISLTHIHRVFPNSMEVHELQ